MAAAPTVVPKSPAIWGRSESVTRTWAWLAKPATASRTIDRVGFGGASGAGIEATGGVFRLGRPPRDAAVDRLRTGGRFTGQTRGNGTNMSGKTQHTDERG